MKLIIYLFALISIASAASISDEAHAQIIRYENKNDGKGNYEFSYETSNGLLREETGKIVNPGQPDEHIEIQGRYSYTNTNGQRVEVKYIADENGYRVIEKDIVSDRVSEFSPVQFGIPPGLVASLLG